MNTYEIRKNDGTSESLNASGYSRDMRTGVIAIYDDSGDKVATYPKGTWVALNVTLPAVKAEPAPSPAIKAQEFALLYGH